MEYTEMQVCREPGSRVDIWPVPLSGVTPKVLFPEPSPSVVRRLLSGGRKDEVWRKRRVVWDGFAWSRDPVDTTWVTQGRIRPPVFSPGPVERREHLVREPTFRRQPGRAHGVRGSGRDQGDRTESVGHSQVARGTIRSEVGAHVYRSRSDALRQLRYDFIWTAADHDETCPETSQAVVHVAERSENERPSGWACRAHQRGIEDEKGENRAQPRGFGQRRVISEAKVATEPQD